MLKIIAGEYKSKKIDFPKKGNTRPISQKNRAAIFNVLSSAVNNSTVLDLFAGSGALGIEAISRGSKKVVFVDNNSESCKTIKKNIEHIGIEIPVEIIKKDAYKYLSNTKNQFDIIFLDPPYLEFDISLVNSAINLLKSTGVIIVSCSSGQDLKSLSKQLKIVQHKVYGDTQIVFLINQ